MFLLTTLNPLWNKGEYNDINLKNSKCQKYLLLIPYKKIDKISQVWRNPGIKTSYMTKMWWKK